ncbi:DUF1127 domain-containing protein [Aestuariibius insulae]|uniref:DUF1127 domain-containing protein n=1 Tax=Aestuariibius insulae TaxID=2058287 RepID=UPI00345EB0A0
MAYAQITRGASASLFDRIADARKTYAQRWGAYRAYRTTFNELNKLTDRDLSDLGLHRSMIQGVAYDAIYGDKA